MVEILLAAMAKRSKKEVPFEKRFKGFWNYVRGRMVEEFAIASDILNGFQVRRTSVGNDYERRRVDPVTGYVGPWEKVEVKTGQSRLTKRQREEALKARKKGVNYVVKRSVDYWGLLGFKEKVVSGRGLRASRGNRKKKPKSKKKDTVFWF